MTTTTILNEHGGADVKVAQGLTGDPVQVELRADVRAFVRGGELAALEVDDIAAWGGLRAERDVAALIDWALAELAN